MNTGGLERAFMMLVLVIIDFLYRDNHKTTKSKTIFPSIIIYESEY